MEYKEEDYLQISGLQHFKFCRRQWALIHIENQWAESWRTTDGKIMHEKAHDASSKERRGDLLVTRDMPVFSRVLGISGVSSDFRDLEAAAPQGNPRAQLALDMFHYWVAKVAGSYVAAMNGVDAIVFTAGVGENSKSSRKAISEYFGYLGVTIDDEANSKRGEDIMISTPDSKVKVFVIPTNEELVIARDTKDIVG